MKSDIQIFFAGDFCSRPPTDKITVSKELKSLIQSCDLKVVNFEAPLKPDTKSPHLGGERLFQNDDAPGFLCGLGFNLFQLANNHAFDWKDEGFLKTKATLADAAFGAGTYEEAMRVKILEVKGEKVGFLACCYAANKGEFNDVSNHDRLGCAYIQDLRMNHVILNAKKEVDYLFVLPHDGIEYIDIPMPETIARYRDFIDYGADGVIGTHPHCPQGWETYKGKPIFYSLGNFLFNSKEGYGYRATDRPYWYEGLCVVLKLSGGEVVPELYYTRNVDNVGIVLEKTMEREEHMRTVCSYLSDREKYKQYFDKAISKLVVEKELPILDTTFHRATFWQSCRALVKFFVHRKLLGRQNDDAGLQRLLRHDTRRFALLRFLKNYPSV